MISYEIAMGLALIGVVLTYGTLDLQEINRAQSGMFLGVLPNWGIFYQPLAFLIFLTAGIAESKRAPFDLPEAEPELISGYFTEYSGAKQAVKVFFFCWLQIMIRWTLPRFRYDQLMILGWKILLPAALLNVMLTALAVLVAESLK
jgi:NADH-quinone oxidoreductase subunit H